MRALRAPGTTGSGQRSALVLSPERLSWPRATRFDCSMAGAPRYLAAMPRDFSTLAIFAWLVAGLACSGRTDKGQQVRPPPQVSVARVEVRDVAVEVHAPIDLRPLTQ